MPSKFCQQFSGVVIDQTDAPEDKLDINNKYVFQPFILPARYARGAVGDDRVPDLTGFQVLVEATDAAGAVLDWKVEYKDSGSFTTAAEGRTTGAPIVGECWMDVFFDEPFVVPRELLSSQWRITLRALNGISGLYYIVPPVNNVVTADFRAYFYNGFVFDDEADDGVPTPTKYIIPTGWNKTQAGAVLATSATSGVNYGQFGFRLLAATADSGTDFLGNAYRSVAVKADPLNVDTVESQNEDSFWLSKPNPSKFAVETLYFDISELGRAKTIDRILMDPITPNVYFYLYYSDEGKPGTTDEEWENKLWTPVHETFQARRRETHALPEPITAKYVKVEFSHLQAQYYAPGNFQRPIRYKKHPKWVLDFFLGQVEARRSSEDFFINRATVVEYDALDLAYNYYLDDLRQEPLTPVATNGRNQNIRDFFLTSDAQDRVDEVTIDSIQTQLDIYRIQPGRLGKFGVLAQFTTTNRLSQYPVERPSSATVRTNDVSSLRRDGIVFEKSHPVMFFFLKCRHTYREVEAEFTHDRAYFVGVRQIAFMRDTYDSLSDTAVYIESTGDNRNAQRNDFRRVDGGWRV